MESTELELDVAAAPPPVHPTPPEEIVAALRGIQALEGLSDEEYLWLAKHGIERKVGAGAILFYQDAPPSGMNVMLRGEVHVSRTTGSNISFFVARTGQLTGLLP